MSTYDRIVRCKICRRPFQSTGGRICAECLERLNRDFIVVADYLDSDSPDKTVGGIEKHTDVPKDIIMYLLREGRISIENPDGGEPCCKLCGKPLTTGRFCDSCRNKFVDKLESLAPSPEAEKKKPETRRTDERRSRMHITSGKHSDGK